MLAEERSLDTKVQRSLSNMVFILSHVQVNTVAMALKSRTAIGAIRYLLWSALCSVVLLVLTLQT